VHQSPTPHPTIDLDFACTYFTSPVPVVANPFPPSTDEKRRPRIIHRESNKFSEKPTTFLMAQDMRGRSWRSLAGVAAARLAPIKDYLAAQRDLRLTRSDPLPTENGFPDGATKRLSWTQRLSKRTNSDSDDVATTERVVLLPGWASKRYHPQIELSNKRAGAHDCLMFEKNSLIVRRCTI